MLQVKIDIALCMLVMIEEKRYAWRQLRQNGRVGRASWEDALMINRSLVQTKPCHCKAPNNGSRICTRPHHCPRRTCAGRMFFFCRRLLRHSLCILVTRFVLVDDMPLSKWYTPSRTCCVFYDPCMKLQVSCTRRFVNHVWTIYELCLIHVWIIYEPCMSMSHEWTKFDTCMNHSCTIYTHFV